MNWQLGRTVGRMERLVQLHLSQCKEPFRQVLADAGCLLHWYRRLG